MTKREFIDTILAAARVVAAEGHAIVPEIVAAQAALESGYGRTVKASKFKNIFGIVDEDSSDGPTVMLPTEEWTNGFTKKIRVMRPFRVYESWEDCIRGYAAIVERYSWYADACEAARRGDAIGYAKGLGAVPSRREPGWAPGPTYSDDVIAVARYWHLID